MARFTPAELIERIRQAPSAAQLSLEEARAQIDATKAPIRPGTAVTRVDVGGVHGEWIVADGVAADSPVILWLHGGGYTMGSCASHRALAANVSTAARASVLLIEYRLAPEHPFPAAIDDAVAAWTWMVSLAERAGRLPIIAGDSAGGGLAVAMMLRLKDEKRPLPAAVVCLSPWTDLTTLKASDGEMAFVDPLVDRDHLQRMADAYTRGARADNPYISPLFGDFTGAPPMLIQVGDERLTDDARALAAAARAGGVDVTFQHWPGMMHVWQLYRGLIDDADRAITSIGSFVRQVANPTSD